MAKKNQSTSTPSHAESKSLHDVHSSVSIPRAPGFWRRLFAFAGPAYMVSVGYMDPGNWATDIEGGSRFAYQLLWILLLSNLMAVLLQTLSARLGIVTGRDLAQGCRDTYPRPVSFILWVLCEIAIAACDLAEVLGTAIGLNLLFGVSLMTGVLITAFDVFLLLAIQRLGIRRMEGAILAMVATVGGCFVFEIFLAKPDWHAVLLGLRPQLASTEALYIAIAMLGATVMPHNLYLHSALVQTRQVARTPEGMAQANRYNLVDSLVALNAAFFVNAAILILAAATFNRHGQVVTELQQAHTLLNPLLGTSLASAAFAVALLCAGQSSTLTGTLAGQVVMEGFLEFRMRPWLRRLITRLLAIIPAVLTIYFMGDKGSYKLLIFSQVVLSLQLPFAVIPLVQFTSDKRRMRQFANGPWVSLLSWAVAVIIVALNAWLLWGIVSEWMTEATTIVRVTVGVGLGVVGLFLAYIVFHPYLRRATRLVEKTETGHPVDLADLPIRSYRRIAVALAADPSDRSVLEHGLSLARASGAELLFVHVAEGFGPRYFGHESDDKETQEDRRYLEAAKSEAERGGTVAHVRLLFGSPVEELVKMVEKDNVDLMVMGAHGHKLLGDILFGSTVEPLRHRVRIPVLVIREDGGEAGSR